jgi:hypothetical protein
LSNTYSAHSPRRRLTLKDVHWEIAHFPKWYIQWTQLQDASLTASLGARVYDRPQTAETNATTNPTLDSVMSLNDERYLRLGIRVAANLQLYKVSSNADRVILVQLWRGIHRERLRDDLLWTYISIRWPYLTPHKDENTAA